MSGKPDPDHGKPCVYETVIEGARPNIYLHSVGGGFDSIGTISEMLTGNRFISLAMYLANKH